MVDTASYERHGDFCQNEHYPSKSHREQSPRTYSIPSSFVQADPDEEDFAPDDVHVDIESLPFPPSYPQHQHQRVPFSNNIPIHQQINRMNREGLDMERRLWDPEVELMRLQRDTVKALDPPRESQYLKIDDVTSTRKRLDFDFLFFA